MGGIVARPRAGYFLVQSSMTTATGRIAERAQWAELPGRRAVRRVLKAAGLFANRQTEQSRMMAVFGFPSGQQVALDCGSTDLAIDPFNTGLVPCIGQEHCFVGFALETRLKEAA